MRGTKKTQYTVEDERIIYVLLSPDTKRFYCRHSTAKTLRNVYRQHVSGYYPKTADWIKSEFGEQGLWPCLIVLESVRCTKVEAFGHVVAWTKILCEAGYESLDQGNVAAYITNLSAKNKGLYEQRKGIDLQDLLDCKNCLVQTYRRVLCRYFVEGKDND